MASQTKADAPLSASLPGTWELLSRIDRMADGTRIPESSLGEDPIAWLIYDRNGHFAAQFMRRDRSVEIEDSAGTAPVAAQAPAKNNSRAQGGYDAYFGLYTIDDAARTVTQTLTGALSRENVGMTLTREMLVEGDALVITIDTTAGDGRAVTRTLTWRRIG